MEWMRENKPLIILIEVITISSCEILRVSAAAVAVAAAAAHLRSQ